MMAISGIEGIPIRYHIILAPIKNIPTAKEASLIKTITGGPRIDPPMITVGNMEKVIGQNLDILA